MPAIGQSGQAVDSGEGRQFLLEVLVFGHVARDRNDPVDFPGAKLFRYPQGRFDSDFLFLAMTAAIDNSRVLHLAALQSRDHCLHPGQILGVHARQRPGLHELFRQPAHVADACSSSPRRARCRRRMPFVPYSYWP